MPHNKKKKNINKILKRTVKYKARLPRRHREFSLLLLKYYSKEIRLSVRVKKSLVRVPLLQDTYSDMPAPPPSPHHNCNILTLYHLKESYRISVSWKGWPMKQSESLYTKNNLDRLIFWTRVPRPSGIMIRRSRVSLVNFIKQDISQILWKWKRVT